jgi:hypothetical protein
VLGREKKDPSPSPPLSSNVPPLSKGRLAVTGSAKSSSSSIPKLKAKSKKERPVLVGVVIPNIIRFLSALPMRACRRLRMWWGGVGRFQLRR